MVDRLAYTPSSATPRVGCRDQAILESEHRQSVELFIGADRLLPDAQFLASNTRRCRS